MNYQTKVGKKDGDIAVLNQRCFRGYMEYRKMVKALMEQTDYEYIANAKIPFQYNKIQLEARFGRVVRASTTDLLINFGKCEDTVPDDKCWMGSPLKNDESPYEVEKVFSLGICRFAKFMRY